MAVPHPFIKRNSEYDPKKDQKILSYHQLMNIIRSHAAAPKLNVRQSAPPKPQRKDGGQGKEQEGNPCGCKAIMSAQIVVQDQ